MHFFLLYLCEDYTSDFLSFLFLWNIKKVQIMEVIKTYTYTAL